MQSFTNILLFDEIMDFSISELLSEIKTFIESSTVSSLPEAFILGPTPKPTISALSPFVMS